MVQAALVEQAAIVALAATLEPDATVVPSATLEPAAIVERDATLGPDGTAVQADSGSPGSADFLAAASPGWMAAPTVAALGSADLFRHGCCY